MVWNPQQYERFREQRKQPFIELLDNLASVRQPGSRAPRIIDLGCGSGALTADVHQRLGASSTVGIDNSAAMLAHSGQHQGDGVRFVCRDIADVIHSGGRELGGPWDVVFSNAALHWLPDHSALVPDITALIAPGGHLAIQVPANHDHPSHLTADEVARMTPYSQALEGYQHGTRVLAPRTYAHILHRLGLVDINVQSRIYCHLLPSLDEVVEWVAGSVLTAYQRRMPADLFARFLEHYRQRLRENVASEGDDEPFLYTYQRIFMWAQKPS